VFASEREAPLTDSAVRKLVARAGKIAGLPMPVHPHMLRHPSDQRRTTCMVEKRADAGGICDKTILECDTGTQATNRKRLILRTSCRPSWRTIIQARCRHPGTQKELRPRRLLAVVAEEIIADCAVQATPMSARFGQTGLRWRRYRRTNRRAPRDGTVVRLRPPDLARWGRAGRAGERRRELGVIAFRPVDAAPQQPLCWVREHSENQAAQIDPGGEDASQAAFADSGAVIAEIGSAVDDVLGGTGTGQTLGAEVPILARGAENDAETVVITWRRP